ncbi:tRNA (cytosine(72)-C(5))-methyltransferase NSUN6-like [Macrobrachium nipponense]|uniref:tRNA (cytosine(72)-C(5))-methyltransferase NSUN6-like n=1 Tax=Macrobrachium nipponense TaxID=159736 RepID=UPI0030C80428
MEKSAQNLHQESTCQAQFTPGKFNPLSDEIVQYILTSSGVLPLKESHDAATKKTEESFSDFLKYFAVLSMPPKYTTVRVNLRKLPLGDALADIECYVNGKCKTNHKSSVYPHPVIPDVIIIESNGIRNVTPETKEVIVGRKCGSAVLRGANVFAPGVMGATPGLKTGEKVAVYSDLDDKCLRGSKAYKGHKMFLGNGIAEKGRLELFRDPKPNGLAVVMDEKVFDCPSFGDFRSDVFYLQNLPSVLCSYVLGPELNGVVLDMCAAPGGKTTHLAAMVGNHGKVIAIDRSKRKVEQIEESAKKLGLGNIHAFVYDSCSLVKENVESESEKLKANDERHEPVSSRNKLVLSPPYAPSSFKWILLDAPCSALGQRPQMQTKCSLKELKSFPVVQQQLLANAVKLLKSGGALVYSTCTIVPEENEKMVRWVLDHFKDVELIDSQPKIGQPGLRNCGLDSYQCRKVQRFGFVDNEGDVPHSYPTDYDRDTIGFFIASFRKL